MADREAWYGDRTEVTIAELLDPGYNAKRRALIGEEASRELRPGHPGGRAPQLSEHAHRVRSGPLELTAPAGSGEPTVARTGETRGDTCHVDVVDRWGNMIAATPSGGWLHSNPVIPALGFPLGTRLQMAWLDPGLPNSLSPGKRPRTTLSPSLALRGGEPVLAFGTPGGDQQDQWSTHFFLAVTQRDRVRGGYDLQGAIDAPNWHTESFPGSFYPRAMKAGAVTVESRIGSSTIDELRRRGHDVTGGSPGRKAGSAPWPAIRRPGCSRPRRTRAGCRGTPPGGDGRCTAAAALIRSAEPEPQDVRIYIPELLAERGRSIAESRCGKPSR